MSVEATIWAWKSQPSKQSEKFILLAMADRAGEDHTCWPSIARLVKDTMLNEKTINTALRSLVNQGLIKDTGRRVGSTRRVKVYCLIGITGRENTPKSESGHSGKTVNSEKANTTKNGGINDAVENPIKYPQKRNDSKNGILPDLPCNTPKNEWTKYPQIRELEPITLEPITEPNTFIDSDEVESTAGEVLDLSVDNQSESKPTKSKRKSKQPVPDAFDVTQQMIDWLSTNQITTNFTIETSKFLDHHRAKGSTMACWVSAWRNWMRNSMVFGNTAMAKNTPSVASQSHKNTKQQVNDSLTNIQDTNW